MKLNDYIESIKNNTLKEISSLENTIKSIKEKIWDILNSKDLSLLERNLNKKRLNLDTFKDLIINYENFKKFIKKKIEPNFYKKYFYKKKINYLFY